MDLIRSELVLILAGIAAIAFLWLWLAAGNKPSSIPPNSARRSRTFRISSIPLGVNKEEFRDILTRLPVTAGVTASQPKWNLLGFSYSPSAASNHAERYAVATATFANAPTLSELEKSIKCEIGIDASRLKVDLDFFGLTPLADPLQDITVDIIAVTGLAGHAFGSWKLKNKTDMWLRDFLPEAVPNARILTYGYDTKLPGSQSEASIPDLSRRLLESIKTVRSGHTKSRALILIGYSLGGLVVKEALAEACEGSQDDQAVFRSCYALLLFAVPNRGLDNSNLMYMVNGQPNEDLVKSLKQSSRFLRMLGERFNKHFTLDDSKIICMYETRMTPTIQWCPETASWERTGPKVMMVPLMSAIHAGPNEKVYDQIPIEADHSEIVKFSDTSNPDYLIIESRIRELVAEAPGVIQERFAKLRRKLSEWEKRYIQALKAPDYAAFRNNKVGNPTPGTLGWFLKNESVRSWLTTSESSALWVQGSPGQGKTILAKFLLANLDLSSKSSHRTTVIYFFFYNQDENYQTLSAALRSLIKQLLLVPDAFRIISNNFDLETSTMTDESMWAILEELLHSSIFDTIYCVIDALDECQDLEARERLIGFIETLIQPPLARRRKKLTTFKTFLTSRPTVDLGRSLRQFPSIQLKASPDDLKIFIDVKIKTIGLPAELERRAIDLLSSRVEQTFLWISIILKKLKTVTTLLSEADIEQIINESPSDLTGLYESIISQVMQSNDKATQKLLIWTVFGRRALALNELEEALAIQENSKSVESIRKYRIQDLTGSKITSAAGIILEIVNGKVYLIHQSAKDFLLKSEHLAKADFCRGLRPDFVETGPCRDSAQLEERNRRHPFFNYAARNWHRHITIDDDIDAFASIIGQLTEPASPGLLAWGEAAGIANLDKARNTWDIAMMANIPWLADFQSRGGVITEEIIEKAASRGFTGYNFIKNLTRRPSVHLTEGAVYAVAKYFDHTIFRQLLDKDANIIITPALMEAAAANQKYGRLVMDLLLESQDNFTVTAELVRLAAENSESGRDIIELIVRKEDTSISEGAVAEIAARFGAETMRILMNSREEIKVTETVMETVMKREFDREEMLIVLLEQQDQDFQITEKFIESIARGFNKEVMELVLEKKDQDFHITERVVKATAENYDNGQEVMTLLLDRRGDHITITEGVVSTIAARFNKKVMTLLLDRQGDHITITEDVVKAAAGNKGNGKEVMTLLLDRRGDHITITEDVVKAAAGNGRNGKEVMTLLLDQRGDHITITEDVVKAAAGNKGNGKEVMTLLLDRRGDHITITEDVVRVAAGNNGMEVMTLLLDRRGDHITITEDVVKAAARNFWNSKEIISLLLDRRGDHITVTEEVTKAAAGNESDGEEVMTLLLDRRGDHITITEDVVKAAAGNSGKGKEIITLLLDRRGDHITITEDIVKAAAGNYWNSKEIITLLLNWRRDYITITEDIVKAAAGNEGSGKEVMILLLDWLGNHITITEDVVKAAAGNEGNGKEVMTLLLDRRGDYITITEDVVKAAAGNGRNGKEIMTLLLDRRGDHITITEDVVKAAAGNIGNGKEIMILLLDRRGDHITITEDVVKAAAGNSWKGKEVMTLLLSWREDHITITEDVVEAAAGNIGNGKEVITLLLDRRGDHITITEDVVKAAAGNSGNGKEVITLLLDRRGDHITITEDVVKAAAGNYWNGKEILTLLLDWRGDHITITEDVVRVAAGNEGNGKEVMTLLLDRRGDYITITEDIIKAAAGNSGNGKEVMTLLLDQHGDNITITEDVIKAAAGNYWNSKEVMRLLLDRRGDHITITEGVVKAAAGNYWNGKEILTLLLDRRGDHITITEDVVKAAAGNEEDGKEVMTLLLDRRGDYITVTEDIVRAAAGNSWNGKEVMTLLLDRRGDHITITEDVIKTAAGNEGNGKEVMTLLLDRRGDHITITEDVVKAAATCGQDRILNLLSRQHNIVFDWDKWCYISKFYNAAKTGDVRCIEQLIGKGTNPDIKNIRGETPLWIAASYGHKAVVKVLAQRTDVDVNSVSISGRSPLFWPSSRGYEEIVAVLLEAGADPHFVDEDGNTAVIMARQNGWKRVTNILERVG